MLSDTTGLLAWSFATGRLRRPWWESFQTLGDLVRAGKSATLRFCDMPAELACKAATIAAQPHMPGTIAMQLEYPLFAHYVEAEHFLAEHDGGMGIMPWSPLAGGFLAGKYRREDTSGIGRMSGANPFGNSRFNRKGPIR